MLVLVVSDFHLGRGDYLQSGQINLMEDFHDDDSFAEFLEFYSSGKFYNYPVHLVLNGDILNLIEVDIDGTFNHIIDDELTVCALKKIIDGHQVFFNALAKFGKRPSKKISYTVGNHDQGMAFLKAQDYLSKTIGVQISFCFEMSIAGVHIEHGQRWDLINSMIGKEWSYEGPKGRQVLNLPLGSFFCIGVLPQFKKDRPYIDKIRPISSYIRWCILHDPLLVIRILIATLKYFYSISMSPYPWRRLDFKTTIKLLRHMHFFPRFDRSAKQILKNDETLKAVVLGHIHLQEWRRFPKNRYYFSSGCWNPIPSVDAAIYEDVARLGYVAIDLYPDREELRTISMKTWKGVWRKYRNVVSVNATDIKN